MSDVIVPEGQDALGSPDAGIGNTATEQAPFLKIDDSTFFNSPDEAIKAFKEGTMRHSEHKKAMSDLENQRRAHENEKSLWFRQQADWDDKIKLYKQVDELFKSNPRAFQTVKQMLQQGATGEDIQSIIDKAIEEKVSPKLSEFEEYQKREQAKAERDKHFASLKEKYEDFDEKAVTEEYDRLFMPGTNMGTLMELIYHAVKGKNINPAAIQKNTLDNLARKQKAGIPSTKGATYSGEKKQTEGDMRQLAEKLKAEAGDS